MKTILIVMIFFCSLSYGHVVTPEMFTEMTQRLEKNPLDVEALMICSHYHENEKMYDEAVADLQKIITIMKIEDPSFHPALFIRLAQLHVNSQQYEKALGVFNQLLTADFCQKNSHLAPIQHAILWRGKIYAELGQYENAWQDAQFVLERNQQMPVYFVEAAKIVEKTADIEKAFSLYQEAAIKFPTPESEPFVVHAINLIVKQDVQKAIALLEKIRTALPQEPYPQFYMTVLALHYSENNILFDEEKQKLQVITDNMIESDACGSYFWQAKIAFIEQKYNEALSFVDKAIATDARPSALYELKAKIYQKLEKLDLQQQSISKCNEMKEKFSYQWLYWCEIER